MSSLLTYNSKSLNFEIFLSSQKWVVPSELSTPLNIIVIGGGGGGGGGYSSNYVGGGGSSSSVVYAKAIVKPGTQLNIVVGAGGSGGTGGSNPTPGNPGGMSYVDLVIKPAGVTSGPLIGALPGGAGLPAKSSANGTGGTPYVISTATGTYYGLVMLGSQYQDVFFVLAAYVLQGMSASGQTPGVTPILPLSFSGSGNTYYGLNNTASNFSYGSGGVGGNVNLNGQPGNQGIVVIWWGDE